MRADSGWLRSFATEARISGVGARPFVAPLGRRLAQREGEHGNQENGEQERTHRARIPPF